MIFHKMGPMTRHDYLHKMTVCNWSWPLTECKNTEFVFELSKIGFCEGGCKWSCPLTWVSVRRASTVVIYNVQL